MNRAADLPTLEHEPIDAAPRPRRGRGAQSKTQAGRAGGKARAARQRTLRNELAIFPFAAANYVMVSIPPLTGTSAQQVAALARHTPALLISLRKWGLRYVPSTDPRALVPFLLAGYTYAQLFHRLAQPPHAVTLAWLNRCERAERALMKHWGSETAARRLFARRAARTAWKVNCEFAAEGLILLRDRPAAALALVRRCGNPACPTPFYCFRGPRASRTCGRTQCQAELRHAATRTRRRVTTQQRQARSFRPASRPTPHRTPLISRLAAR